MATTRGRDIYPYDSIIHATSTGRLSMLAVIEVGSRPLRPLRGIACLPFPAEVVHSTALLEFMSIWPELFKNSSLSSTFGDLDVDLPGTCSPAPWVILAVGFPSNEGWSQRFKMWLPIDQTQLGYLPGNAGQAPPENSRRTLKKLVVHSRRGRLQRVMRNLKSRRLEIR